MYITINLNNLQVNEFTISFHFLYIYITKFLQAVTSEFRYVCILRE